MTSTVVANAQELAYALNAGALEVEVQGTITGSPMITLPPGTTVRGPVALAIGQADAVRGNILTPRRVD